MPQFIAPQDGSEKQDCERNTAKHWLATHAKRLEELRPVYLGEAGQGSSGEAVGIARRGDDLFACQPIAEAITKAGGDFLLTAKSASHKALYDFMQGAARNEQSITHKTAGKRLTYRYRWFEGVPLRDSKDAMVVNWLGITNAKGKVAYQNAFVTSLPVTTDTVAELVACARARWKIENESFNVLKSNGYHLEHNFGHGKQNLAMMFAALNLLAFAIHTVCDCLEQLWIDARTAKRARKRFFEHIRTITAYLVFSNWRTLLQTLIDSKPPPDVEAQFAS
jgi:DDE family transposase